MKKTAIATILSAALLASLPRTGSAEPVRPNERYCIEMAEQGGPGGPPQCMFETLAQCIASKTAPNDRCMLNPRLATGG
jgi:Protein of unknown function (DUF3551)